MRRDEVRIERRLVCLGVCWFGGEKMERFVVKSTGNQIHEAKGCNTYLSIYPTPHQDFEGSHSSYAYYTYEGFLLVPKTGCSYP